MSEKGKESSPEWTRYRRLLRAYTKAAKAHAFLGNALPEEWPWIENDFRQARKSLDAFVTILLGINK